MVEAILRGERDPEKLITLKDHRIKATDEDIKKSLEGIWKEEYLFMLKQAYQEYQFYQSQIEECEQIIKDQLLNQAAYILEGDITHIQMEKKSAKRTSLAIK